MQKMQKMAFIKDHHEILQGLNQFSNIRYVAYRTAAKMKFIQNQTKLEYVKLTHVFQVIDDFGLRSSVKELLLNIQEVRKLVLDVYMLAQKDILVHLNHKVSAKIVADLLIDTFDNSGKNKGCTLLNIAVFFTILCGDTALGEKYRKLLHLISDHNSCIQRNNMAILLKAIASVAHLVNEAPAFGHWTVAAAVQQCFEQHNLTSLPEDECFRWMVCEPQSLVWWSTLYRINASNKVIHSVRCAVCNASPIIGLRYQCLKCLAYNNCQQCFWLGLVSKSHKMNHQMQEYCSKTTPKEATRALWKKLSNWLTLKKNRPSPARYLPLERLDFKYSQMSLNQTAAIEIHNKRKYENDDIPTGQQIASVVGYLLEEKGKLESVLQQTDSNSLGPIVKKHCDQLEKQLKKLIQLASLMNDPLIDNLQPKITRMLTRLESTPLLPNQQRQNELEQLNFSPINEPFNCTQRSSRERRSLRTGTKPTATIVTNGTLNYCTPRLIRKESLTAANSTSIREEDSLPRFSTDFSLRDLSRKLDLVPHTLLQSSSGGDTQLNAELEEILIQLDLLFPNSSKSSSLDNGTNATLVRATNQMTGVLAEFVDCFQN